MAKINTAQDSSGQDNVLKGKIIKTLWQDKDLCLPLQHTYDGWSRLKRRFQNNLHTIKFTTEISEVYDFITDYEEFSGD